MAKRKTGMGRGLAALIPSQSKLSRQQTSDSDLADNVSPHALDNNQRAKQAGVSGQDKSTAGQQSTSSPSKKDKTNQGDITNDPFKGKRDLEATPKQGETERPSDIFFNGGGQGRTTRHKRGGSVSELLSPPANVSRETIRRKVGADTKRTSGAGSKLASASSSKLNPVEASQLEEAKSKILNNLSDSVNSKEFSESGNATHNRKQKGLASKKDNAEAAVEKEMINRIDRYGSLSKDSDNAHQVKKADSDSTGAHKDLGKKHKATNSSAKDENLKQREKTADSQKKTSGDSDLVSIPGAVLRDVKLELIHPNLSQPRQVFDEDDLEELADSLREVGLLQPIVVREDPDQPGTYEIVMGERRWRAAELAGFDTIPVIIREVANNDMLRDALLENLHRVQLNPLEEAAAYQQLMQDFGCTQAQLSGRVARSRSQIANTMRLLRLPPAVQSKVAAGVISAGHARALLGLSDPDEQVKLAERIIAEGLSVRTTEEIVTLGLSKQGKSNKRGDVRSQSNPLPQAYRQIAEEWTDFFDTRVTIRPGKKLSKLVIEFTDQDDLERITTALKESQKDD